MTSQPQPAPDTSGPPEPRDRPRTAPATPRGWTARDLAGHARRHGVRPYVIVAAMRAAEKETLDSPDEVRALIDEFMHKPLARTYP